MSNETIPFSSPEQALHAVLSNDPAVYEPASPTNSEQVSPATPQIPAEPQTPIPNSATPPDGSAGVQAQPDAPQFVPVNIRGVTVQLPPEAAAAYQADQNHWRAVQARLDREAVQQRMAQLAQPQQPQPVQAPQQPAQTAQRVSVTPEQIERQEAAVLALNNEGRVDEALKASMELQRMQRQQFLEINGYLKQDLDQFKQQAQQQQAQAAIQQFVSNEISVIEKDFAGSGIDPHTVYAELDAYRQNAIAQGHNPKFVFGPEWSNEWYGAIKQKYLPSSPGPIQPGPQQVTPTQNSPSPTGGAVYRAVPSAVLPTGSASLRAPAHDRAQFDQSKPSGYVRQPAEGSLDRALQSR